ncbi:GntR family transcriptional regulator [Paenarthrobacter sp. NPDC089989]|uniref:GntR family transcriptional regulator n=1 Tax=unclassified Paenarthrobacter TaxID=2634190 RepID=UPI00381C58EF
MQRGGKARESGSMEDVLQGIEEAIALGSLYPRERLVEDELMEQFGAKRHVVRRALLELEARGMVERRRNVGALVRAYTAREVREVYVVRELLETHAIGLIQPPVDPGLLEELKALQRRHDAAAEAGDARGTMYANMAFHEAIFALSGNDALVEAIRLHARKTYAMRSITVNSPAILTNARHEHWEMINALEAGDIQKVADVARAHLLPSRDAYLTRVADKESLAASS